MDRATAARSAYVAHAFPVLTQTFTWQEVAALRRRGLDVRVFASRPGPDADLDPGAREEGARASYLPHPFSPSALVAAAGWLVRRPVRFLTTALACLGGGYRDDAVRCRMRAPAHVLLGAALARALDREGPFTRVHAQFVDAGSTVAYVAARLLDLPFSFANHTAYNPFLLAPKCRHADRIVSITDYDRELLMRQAHGAAEPSKVVVCRVGIPLREWTSVVRRPEAGRVLIVGALREKKGHAVLVRALARLGAEGIRTTLVVAGGGAEESALRALATELGVSAEFLGPVGPDRVREELARAAVFALPCVVAANGDLDGLPVALMEAMAAGVPSVSTRLSGVPELIVHEESGLLAAPGDPDTLAECVARFLSDPSFAERCGRNGADRVAVLHDLETTSGRLAACLAAVPA